MEVENDQKLTVVEKQKLLRKLYKGEKFSDLGVFYGVRGATAYDTKKIKGFGKIF